MTTAVSMPAASASAVAAAADVPENQQNFRQRQINEQKDENET